MLFRFLQIHKRSIQARDMATLVLKASLIYNRTFFICFPAIQTPFMLEVVTDDATAKVLASDGTAAATGFEMVFPSILCKTSLTIKMSRPTTS